MPDEHHMAEADGGSIARHDQEIAEAVQELASCRAFFLFTLKKDGHVAQAHGSFCNITALNAVGFLNMIQELAAESIGDVEDEVDKYLEENTP